MPLPFSFQVTTELNAKLSYTKTVLGVFSWCLPYNIPFRESDSSLLAPILATACVLVV